MDNFSMQLQSALFYLNNGVFVCLYLSLNTLLGYILGYNGVLIIRNMDLGTCHMF